MADLFVGQFAKEAGINVETVRYYEKIKLLPRPKRRESRYRLYNETDLKRLLFIKRAKEIGFTLREIKELLELKIDSEAKCGDVKHFAESKLRDVKNRINDLTRIKNVLEGLVAQCEREEISADECPILESIDY